MRKTLLTILTSLTIFLTQDSFSQDGRIQIPAEYVRQHLMGNNKLPDNIQGSPYVADSFLPGQVLINDNEPFRALLRYNAYLDEIQMKDDQNKTISLLKRNYIRARIVDDFYVIVDYIDSNGNKKQGYMVKVEEGNASLYRQNKKLFIEAKEATSSYGKDHPAKLVEKITYFLKKKDGLLTEMKFKKKEILKMLGDKDSELKKYILESNLKLKNETEVVQLIKHYNGI